MWGDFNGNQNSDGPGCGNGDMDINCDVAPPAVAAALANVDQKYQ